MRRIFGSKPDETSPERSPAADVYVLCLYVSGSTPRSIAAIQNLKEICDAHLQGRHEIQVIDIGRHPEQARSEQIVAVPTLIRKQPLPVRRLVGRLSDRDRVLAALDLAPPRAGD